MATKRLFPAILAGILGCSIISSLVSAASDSGISGDVNADGMFNVTDVIALQKWLLNDGTKLADWEMGDFYQDGVLDVFDLCLMKRELFRSSRTVQVSTTEELRNALKNAESGDTILLAGGEYEWGQKGTAGSLFMATAEGTADMPITVKSMDKSDPAILKGTSYSDGMVLYITGDHWNIEDIVFCNAKKGIMLDNSNDTTIRNVTVYDIGEEGIHIRDGSSNCQVISANVHDCGLLRADRGEGIYIGSAKSTTGYAYGCNNNFVQNCIIGPNVTAECIDIKEYTTGNIVENCTMYGDGMTATDSFIDVKGNEVTVRNNSFYDDGNTNIADAVQVHCQVEGWGCDNKIYDNTTYLTSETAYVVRSWSGTSCTVWSNIRNPESDTYLYRAYNGSTMEVLEP